MNVTAETLALLKAAQATPNGDITNDTLRKSVTTGTGLVGYDLQAPAKNLYPVLTPLRNAIPRVPGETGTATNWRVVSAITGSGYSAMPWVPEGQRSARMSYTTSNKAATYVTIGEEDQVSYESVTAARSFEDIKATAAIRLLQQTMIKEENAILGGNNSLALGTPATPTVVGSNSGGSLASATYNVIVVALTYEGYKMASISGGVATSQVITGADGLTYTLNGGSSQKSASASSGAITGPNGSITGTVTAIAGAAAYAWYCGTAGNEKITAITTINSVLITSIASQGTQNASAVTADNSQNASLAYDGLLTWAAKSGGYVSSLATGTAGTGTPLTSSGRGSVNEIDTALQSLWDNYRLSPSVMYVNSQEYKNITNKVLSNASGPLLRYTAAADDANMSEYRMVASGGIDFYFNPFALDGGRKIPIKIHPTIPPGTILLHTTDLPAQYQSNHVPNVAEVKERRGYYQIDWPPRTRQYEMGVYAEEVLAVYAPFAIGVIYNIGNG